MKPILSNKNSDAYQFGWVAFADGLPANACPHYYSKLRSSNPELTIEEYDSSHRINMDDWLNGWLDHKQKLNPVFRKRKK